jgi:hypothetical protein
MLLQGAEVSKHRLRLMKTVDIIEAHSLLVYYSLHLGLIRPQQHGRPCVLVEEYRHLSLFVTIEGRETHTFPGL